MNFFTNRFVAEWLEGLGGLALLAKESLNSLFTLKVTWRDFIYQLYFIGGEIPVRRPDHRRVHRHGPLRADVFPVSQGENGHRHPRRRERLHVQRTGPVLTALMVAGRVGASMAAELGTMKVTEQIDALRTLATHAGRLSRRAPAPRLFRLPAHADRGIHHLWHLFGLPRWRVLLDIDPTYLYANMLKHTYEVDVVVGLIKAFIFGGIIAIIGCYKE